jgi:hypothetical protein
LLSAAVATVTTVTVFPTPMIPIAMVVTLADIDMGAWDANHYLGSCLRQRGDAHRTKSHARGQKRFHCKFLLACMPLQRGCAAQVPMPWNQPICVRPIELRALIDRSHACPN